ncbi:hypothetical protein ABVK25_000271 [Lepraria finkii]|uniref:Uncharacterized protein n=1 Tax=Lepraria finkii TaxID=1340010 RepID=A0ABR4BMF9_9LECA
MSSPANRRSQQAQPQGTPQVARQNVTSSSPLFFRSSPAATPSAPIDNANMDISSPLKQASIAGSTHRAPPGDSSPIRYAPSSSPTRALNATQEPNLPTSSSGLFVRSSRVSAPGSSGLNNSRRGDIHSDIFGSSSTPSRRRRLFVDENGVPVRDGPSDPATFPNLDPNTSEADAIGGSST